MRIAHQSGHLRLITPTAPRSSRTRCRARSAEIDPRQYGRRRRRRRGYRAMAGRVEAAQGPPAPDRPPHQQSSKPRRATRIAATGCGHRACRWPRSALRSKTTNEADWRAEHYASAAERRRARKPHSHAWFRAGKTWSSRNTSSPCASSHRPRTRRRRRSAAGVAAVEPHPHPSPWRWRGELSPSIGRMRSNHAVRRWFVIARPSRQRGRGNLWRPYRR